MKAYEIKTTDKLKSNTQGRPILEGQEFVSMNRKDTMTTQQKEFIYHMIMQLEMFKNKHINI